ncbi:MAG: DUF58 domain-containing protein [Pseudoxanthomonas sp.]
MRDRFEALLARLARPRTRERLPVLLDRRRVYVLPTGFGLFFALLMLAMLAGALNYNNNPALMLCLLLGTTGLASLITAHLQLSGLRIDTVHAEPVQAGQPLLLQVGVSTGDGRVRRGLQLRHAPLQSRIPELAQEPVVVTLEIPTEVRGLHALARLRLSTTQPLGLALAWSWVWPEVSLLVYPKAEQQGPPLPEGGGSARQSVLNPAGEDVHHLRPYRPGDPQRAVAWKPSARRDMLMVREFEQPRGVEVMLDWQGLSALPYEQRIQRLAHWVDLAEQQSRRYRLSLPGQPALGPAQGAAHRHRCLRALALMPSEARR